MEIFFSNFSENPFLKKYMARGEKRGEMVLNGNIEKRLKFLFYQDRFLRGMPFSNNLIYNYHFNFNIIKSILTFLPHFIHSFVPIPYHNFFILFIYLNHFASVFLLDHLLHLLQRFLEQRLRWKFPSFWCLCTWHELQHHLLLIVFVQLQIYCSFNMWFFMLLNFDATLILLALNIFFNHEGADVHGSADMVVSFLVDGEILQVGDEVFGFVGGSPELIPCCFEVTVDGDANDCMIIH